MRRIALAVLIGSAVLSNLLLLGRAVDLDVMSRDLDAITLYERRFEALRRSLPARGVVGYLSDRQADDIRFDAGAADYYLTQYALAPVVVAYSPDHPLVVGNFGDAPVDPRVYTSRNLVPLRDFGNGVMLFRKQGE